MKKKATTIYIDEDVFVDMKVHCIRTQQTIAQYLTNLIKIDLEKNKKKSEC